MKKALGAMAVLLLCAAPAMADFQEVSNIVTSDGTHWEFTDLNVAQGSALRLFEPPGTTLPSGAPDDSIWTHNNTSPIVALPGDYVPSPEGTAAGEMFDIEGLFWDYDGTNLEVWVVTSIAPDGTPYSGVNYHLGDVFINSDDNMSTGAEGYEYALLSFNALPGIPANNPVYEEDGTSTVSTTWDGTGRAAGALVTLGGSEDLYGINGDRSYAGNAAVALEANPWAVSDLDGASAGTLDYQEVAPSDGVPYVDDLDNDPLASGQSTYIYHWAVALSLDDDALDAMSIPGAFHVTVQCGNDAGDNGGGPGGGGDIPAPGALILGILGAGLVGLRRRMRG